VFILRLLDGSKIKKHQVSTDKNVEDFKFDGFKVQQPLSNGPIHPEYPAAMMLFNLLHQQA